MNILLKKLKRVIIFFCLSVLFCSILTSQEKESTSQNEIASKNELASKNEPTVGNHFLAIGETIGSNLFLMGVNRYIRDVPYAYISWDSIHTNLTNPWVWDQDSFPVNHLGHPYQGSYYYVAGRSNNLPVWESLLVTLFGSVTWEYFAETDTPSYNDLIVTPIGGLSLGEILYRLYCQVAVHNKFLAFFISPIAGINHAILKDKMNMPDEEIYSLDTVIDLGFTSDHISFENNYISRDDKITPVYFGAGVNIIYGNPYGLSTFTPYSQFDVHLNCSVSKDYYNVSLFSNGILASFSPCETDKVHTTLGASLHYDVIMSSDIDYSTNSIGFTARQKINLPANWEIKWDFHLNYVMLSASDYFYLFSGYIPNPDPEKENRIYDLGYGGGIKTAFSISQPAAGTLKFYSLFNIIKTINDSIPENGSKGFSLISLSSASYEHNIYKSFIIGFEYSPYFKYGFYEDSGDTFEFNQAAKIYFKNKFK